MDVYTRDGLVWSNLLDQASAPNDFLGKESSIREIEMHTTLLQRDEIVGLKRLRRCYPIQKNAGTVQGLAT